MMGRESQIDSTGGRGGFQVERALLVQGANALGRLFGPWGNHPFVAERLLEEACRLTDLEDFGSPSLENQLRRLLSSLETESHLNSMGRLATRQDILRLLVNRLRLESERKRHPAIAEVQIVRPIMITGLPRTGTTLLHRLLALDPHTRVARTWEAMRPSPAPTAETYNRDGRIRKAERELRWLSRFVKHFNRIHPTDARYPEECLVLFSHSFLSYQFETTHRLPGYLDWLMAQDLRPAYEMHKRILQHLQWRCPKERWVLKAPAHIFDLEALFAIYPDACIVMSHREPTEISASNASLTATLRSAFSDEVNPFELGPECSRRWAEGIARAMRARDCGQVPSERYLDLYYIDLLADPVGAVRKIYNRFELPFPENMAEAIHLFIQNNPQDQFGRHRYHLEDFGLSAEVEKASYAAYRERFRL